MEFSLIGESERPTCAALFTEEWEILRKREEMNSMRSYRGVISRVNILLSLVFVVMSFASCSGQSRLMGFTPEQPAAAPVSSSAPVNVQGSYADLVSRV
jgi:hypothetical protein